MKKVFIFLADGFEETEAITPADLLRRAGANVSLVSMNATTAVTGSHNIQINADALFDRCDWNEAVMLVLPGGKTGTDNLESCAALRELLVSASGKGITLAAICAAPRILGQLGLLRGKQACCYPGEETKLQCAQVIYEPVAAAEGVITSRGMGTAFDFGLALVAHLFGEDAANEVARRTVYK